MDESPYITVSELADYLRVHEMTIYRWLKAGQIKGGVKIGGRWRIHKETFDKDKAQ